MDFYGCWIIVESGKVNKHGNQILRIMDYDEYVSEFWRDMHPYMLSYVEQFLARDGVTFATSIPYYGE